MTNVCKCDICGEVDSEESMVSIDFDVSIVEHVCDTCWDEFKDFVRSKKKKEKKKGFFG